MRRPALLLVVLALAATAAGTAGAGFVPAWSYVPPTLRAQLARASGGSLYLPARVPSFYRYRSGAKVDGGTLSVPFTNRVRVRQGLWRWTSQTFLWQVQPLAGAPACESWKTRDKTLQLSGNKVYLSTADGVAWRCVSDPSGRTLVLSASQATPTGPVGVATAVASGLDVSRRTSAVTVALAVTPSTVRRGGTVLVHGVAGGCASGDSVTLISHAFSPARSFAGVPAVFAPVGSAGRFSTRATIPGTRAAGRYVITARCGGGNLGVSATLTVTR
jgi:hypothetical protein